MKSILIILLLTTKLCLGLDISAGGAYYSDDDLEGAALYTQLALLDVDPVKLGLGIIIPFAGEQYVGGRSCPEISITYNYNNWEVGTYYAMNYYHGWGFLLGYKIWDL